MGTHWSPPTRVLEVPVKWTRPVRSPTDLQVDIETISTTLAILEDLRRPYLNPERPAGLVAQVSPLRSRHGNASRSADRGIHPVITEDGLPKL
jgi:hypothetical protein